MSPTPLDRLMQAFRALVHAEFPALTFLGTYEYKVTATDGNTGSPSTTIDGTPTDSTISLPALSKVKIVLPYRVTPPVGALARIQFMNGDPSRPRCVGFDVPMTFMVLGADSGPMAARVGDTVTVLLPPAVFVGTIVVGGVPSPATGAVAWAVPQTLGNITTGSPAVEIAP
jgi:hypothetical protein